MAKNPPTTIRLSPEVQEAIERIAEDDGRSISNTIELAAKELAERRGYLSRAARPRCQPAPERRPAAAGNAKHGPFAGKLPSGRWVAMLDGIHLPGSYSSRKKALEAAQEAAHGVTNAVDDDDPPTMPAKRAAKDGSHD